MSETTQRIRTGVSTVAHRVVGVGGIRDEQRREAAAEVRRRTDDAIATPLVNGHPIEASKNFMSAHPGRSAMALLALGAIGFTPAKESGVIGNFADMGRGIANVLVPERFEPANYCHTGGGLLGIINFDYKGDDKSAPGDCDYGVTVQKRASQGVDVVPAETPTVIPTVAPTAPATNVPNEVPSAPTQGMPESVAAPAGAGGLVLGRLCLGLPADAPFSQEVKNRWDAMLANSLNSAAYADGIQVGEEYKC